MSSVADIEDLLRDAAQAVQAVDAAAFPVLPRILRRVVKQDHELPGLGIQVPHRKSYVITRDRLLWLVAKDELGLDPDDRVPPLVILLAHPGEQRLATMDLGDLLLHYWRLLFHARIHVALEEQIASGRLTPAVVRSRIDHIGQAEFDEIHAVLRQENYLLHPNDYQATYVEFAAVYWELRFFAASWLPTYFPSLDDLDRIDAVLSQDVDAASLFGGTRPDGAAFPKRKMTPVEEDVPTSWEAEATLAASSEPHPKRFRKWLARAERVGLRGNSVRAAILRMHAARVAPPDKVQETSAAALEELERFMRRLQAALGFSESEAAEWRSALWGLLANSAHGFWNADKRLLYDLQKVCVDHEREISIVDVSVWLRSLGKRPIKRALPNQRELMMAKHLRSATRRLATARLSGDERERLSRLLHAATRSAEKQLRTRLRPLVETSFSEVGLVPQCLPERVAFDKLVEELLDTIVHQGYLTIANLRDAVSRNELKLDDVSGPMELVRGDRLIRADKRLSLALDGVYRRGEFYLRLLQGLSSLSFGTRVGRFLTQYVAIPFGGAFVILEGLSHLLEVLIEPAPHILTPVSFSGLGTFLLALIHVRAFRKSLKEIVTAFFHVARGLIVDIPRRLMNLISIRRFLRSLPVVIFRRFILNPLLMTGGVWAFLSWSDSYRTMNFPELVTAFLILALVLNSRIGRDLEEMSMELAVRTWYKIRVRVFVALYEIVMDTFRRFVEWIERFLYAVDEWLRFKSGETSLTLVFKAVLGVVWSAVTYVVRLCVNLLIEPQINPIKHFPVVTVSHKVILPSLPFLAQILANPLGPVMAKTVATTVVFLLPGVFGFLVWELKANWRLYAANRPRRIKPVRVGDHGETVVRLLKPGLHSGTVPKLFTKLRRAERKALSAARFRKARSKYTEKLHHLEQALRRFVQREFVTLLDVSGCWPETPVTVGRIKLASNSIRIELRCDALSDRGVWLAFQEQSGWMIAGMLNTGWLIDLEPIQMETFRTALGGLYKRAGVDLVHEQIESCFEPHTFSYDVGDRGLIVWPDPGFETEVRYDLQQRPVLNPRPRMAAQSFEMPRIDSAQLIFAESAIPWRLWVGAWENFAQGTPAPPVLPEQVKLVPETQRLPLVESHE